VSIWVRLPAIAAELRRVGAERFTTRHAKAVGSALAGNVIPVAIATATDWSSHHTVFFVGAVGACAVPLVVTMVPRRFRTIRRAAAFAGLPMLTLLQAYSGGAASGYSVLMMMAMVWFGLRGSDEEVVAMIALLAACSFLPMLLIGPPAYPVSWGHATLLVLIGATVAGSLRMAMRETRRLTERLRKEAVIDPLTGLLNRRGWELAAEQTLAQARRSGGFVSLIAFDLDEFKQLNDTLGHDQGDRVLRETAERMRITLRASDIVARLGGDEFAALLISSTSDAALTVLGRLREITPARASFSAGIANWADNEQLDDLLRRADLALYAAKAGGGNRTENAPKAFTTDMVEA
jgi:diguanylate cyclase (GGDEF)-like protein